MVATLSLPEPFGVAQRPRPGLLPDRNPADESIRPSRTLSVVLTLSEAANRTGPQAVSEARSAVDRLEAAEDSQAEQRRNAAKQRIAQIKAQLDALRLLSGLNSEATARQAAELARHLAEAVKAYARDGGTTHDGAMVSGPTAAGGVGGSVSAPPTESGDTPSPLQASLSASAQAGETRTQPAVAPAAAGAEPDGSTGDAPNPDRGGPGSTQAHRSDTLSTQSLETDRDSERDRSPLAVDVERAEFVKAVQRLTHAIEAIIAERRDKAARDGSDASEDSLEQAEDHVSKIERVLIDLSRRTRPPISAVSILV